MKTDITNDIILIENFVKEIGFHKDNVYGTWHYGNLSIKLFILDYPGYSSKYLLPHIKLSLKYDDIEDTSDYIDVNITQSWLDIRRILLSSSITDLGIKPLNRSIKLYCILNNIKYEESPNGSISCIALKLDKSLILNFKSILV